MSWCKASFSAQQVMAGELIALVSDFEFLFSELGNPQGMAMFRGEASPAASAVYFSPGCFERAAQLIAAYSGSPCEGPDKESLEFLAGDAGVLDALP
jgi:hypothetical protein